MTEIQLRPGWYNDPWGPHLRMRWWTGRDWANYTYSRKPARRRPRLGVGSVLGAVVLVCWIPIKFTLRGLSLLVR